jgi:MerR family transcriptional regulator/heat shock protein HspR
MNHESELNLGREIPAEDETYRTNDTTYYSLEVTTRKTRLGRTIVERCVSYGIIHPVDRLESIQQQGPFYSETDLLRLRRVRRLINELGLNWAGVEVVMRLTDELEALRTELARLRKL